MPYKNSKFHIIWWWIAGLSAAVYLIQEWKIKWEQITIYDKSKKFWWALDVKDLNHSEWYVMRWIRMFEEEVFTCTFDLMSRIPALHKKKKTIRDKFVKFNNKYKSFSKSRLIMDWKAIDSKTLKLSTKDRLNISKLLYRKESTLENIEIRDYFTPAFFTSNFWFEFCTVFAFQPWHSLTEFRRYFIRFIQTFPNIDTLETAEISPYNQYESMVLPIIEWLKNENINFIDNTKITNIEFKSVQDKKAISWIICKKDDDLFNIDVNDNDFVFTTLGSMIANSSIWSMKKVPEINLEKKTAAWSLWENISKDNPEFWNPKVFSSHIDKSRWTSFTVTFKDPLFYNLMQEFVNKEITDFWWVNLIKSNWFMSIVLSYKAYFIDQPKDITFCWWYWLSSEKEWNYIKKKMSECTWEEILTELVYHLWFEKHLDKILKTSVCIPCTTPYVTSQFLPRKAWDRPLVIPKSSINFAFLWQFCEIPKDVVFTVEYSVRSAQTAVYSLLKLRKRPNKIYNWTHNPKVLFNAMKTLFR